MARCGCSAGGCSCKIIGDRTPECILTTVSGTGISDDAYIISADPIMDPDARNLLTCSGAGLLAAAYLTLGPGSCLTVSGNGTLTNPFVLATTASQDDLAPFAKTGALTAPYTGVSRFRFPFDATLLGVSAAVNTAPTGDDIILDVNKNGSTLYTVSSQPTIVAGTFATGSSEIVPDITAISSGDYLTVDVDQVGSTIPGSDLTLFVHYTRLITCSGGL